jgi:peptidoglycan hydrolase-like protein with peptidoglycan-binding domain
VIAFQRAAGLTATGIIDQKTWAALEAGAPVIPDNKEQCLRAGGVWDEATQTCKLNGGKPPTPVLLYAGIGVAALLAGVAGYHLVRGKG